MTLVSCSRCKEKKEKSEYYRDKSKKTGIRPSCKKCDLLSVNRERRAEYEKEYWDSRRVKRRKQVMNSHNKNKEHHKNKRREYLKTDAGIKMYRKQTQKRYALKKNAFIEDVSPHNKFIEQDGICYICNNKFLFKEMELDHIVPLSKGGLHANNNTSMACIKCNRSKGDKLIEEVHHQVV